MTVQEMKIVTLGETAVGKTSLIYRYISNAFDDRPASTITASFYTKTVIVDNKTVRLLLWDTAGQERFQSITPMYYRNADIIFVVFAVDSANSLQRAIQQTQDIRHKQNYKQHIVLIGNKCDQPNLVKDEAESYAKDFQIPIFFISAKSGLNVQEALQQSVRRVLQDTQAENQKPDKLIQEVSTKACC
ncbi:Rab1a [Hexamita inflata]|uniref:Rab1a n=1 Tax=Hexamita inflata TaxID=28002 RepID=A0AA86TK68_9EUKA|nr:Rab1a [Hexamita inflata]